jgi:hypothetical protein
MNKIMVIFLTGLLICFLTDIASGSGNYLIAPPIPSDIRIGKGCTTAYHIDEDCDGYGIGDGFSDLTIDPDDNDPTVYDLASAEAKYGSFRTGNYIANLKNFYCTTRGAGYCQIGDIYFISTTGNNATGVKNDITKPFQTMQYVYDNKFASGNMMLLRGGTYTSGGSNTLYINYGAAKHGVSSSKPNIVAGFPGERAILGENVGNKIRAMDNWYWIFDSLQIGRTDADGAANGIYADGIHFWIVKNSFLVRNLTNWWTMTGTDSTCRETVSVTEDLNDDGVPESRNLSNCLCPSNILVDRVVSVASGASSGSHTYYWGCRGAYYPSADPNRGAVFANSTVRNCISHSQTSGWDGFQANGYFSNLVMENNVLHSHGQNGVNWLNGVWSSKFRNNLIFNNNGRGLQLFIYSTNWTSEMKDNLIEGNTIWSGYNNNPHGGGQLAKDCGAIWLQNDAASNYMIRRNTFRSNIFVSYSDGTNAPVHESQLNYFPVNNFIKNVFYRLKPGSTIMASGGPYQSPTNFYTLSQFETAYPNSYGNIFSDPLFVDMSTSYNNFPGKYNFDLRAGSPAINLGTPSTGLTLDLKGRARLGNPDAGGYEFGATTSPTTPPIDTTPPNPPSGLKVIP